MWNHAMLLALAVTAAAVGSAAEYLPVVANPYQKGKYQDQLGFINHGTYLNPEDDSNEIHLFIVAPNITMPSPEIRKIEDSENDEADISMPVFAFWTAFAGKVPSPMYSEFFTHIASHGIIVVGMDTSETASGMDFEKTMAKILGVTLEWLAEGNLLELMQGFGIEGVIPDFSHGWSLGGHSAGGHTVTQLLTDDCSDVTALVLLDPVDGLGPFGAFSGIDAWESVIHPPKRVNFEIPLLHLDNLMDPLSAFPAFPYYPSCAPQNMSNDKFFNAWRGPAWQINATYFGHMDNVNMGAQEKLNSAFDLVCAGNRTGDNQEYIALTGGAVVSFIDMLFARKENALARSFLEDATLMPTAVSLRRELRGFKPPYYGFCSSV